MTTADPPFVPTPELLALAHEAGKLGIFEWDLAKDLVRLSPQLRSLYGLEGFDGRVATLLAKIFREDRPRIAYDFQTVVKRQEREILTEFRITRGDGRPPSWIEAQNLVFYGDDGRPLRVIGVNVDITERKHAQVKLRTFTESLEEAVRERRRTEEALREESAALDTLNQTGTALAGELDLERIVQRVTDAGVELTRAKFGAFFYNVLKEQGGSYMLYTLSGVERAAFANFPMPRPTAVFGPTFEGKGVIRSQDITQDPRYGQNMPYRGMPDGHLPVRSYLALPVASRSGEIIGGLFFGHPEPNVFDRRCESLGVGLASQAAIAIDNARLFQAVQSANETLERRVAERTAELEAAHEALRQAQKMEAIGQLTGGIAHDFNNLLTIVQGGLELIGKQIPALGDSPIGQRIDKARAMAHQGVQRAVTVTSRLLAFSRQQPLSPRPLDVNRLLSGTGAFLSRSLGELIRLETVLSGGLWYAEVDPNELENALLNLALNARDAMPQGGKLTIETANCFLDGDYVAGLVESVDAGQYVMIAVADTGTGMDKDTASRVFEPFFTTKEVGKGTGLGLSQVYGFVRQSAGHIRVYSELGEGTSIKIYLPRASNEDADAGDAQPNAPEPRASGTETILVVEDDDDLRAYSTQMLEELGYHVLAAADGQAALRQLTDGGRIDILFTDVVMPGRLNGRQLADKAVELRPGLKVLFTTGYTRNAIVHRGRLDADVQLISKPFSVHQLAKRIRDLLDAPRT